MAGKENQPRDEKEIEIERLRARVKGYEQLMGKLTSGYPSGKLHDHQEFFKGRDIQFGFVTDTHLCSTQERLHDLDTTYKIFQKEGIGVVYHAGDMVAGVGVYRGQNNELKVWGMDNQAEYVRKQYPKVASIKTYFITGNHDLSFLTEAGADIGGLIETKRNDLIYLDQIEGDVRLAREVMMRLYHGGKGAAYALSYHGQRLIASLEPGQKPNILLAGHYHQPFYMDHRNIHYLQGGCFTGYVGITTSEGEKRIASIKVGELVLTSQNRFQRVTKVFSRKYEGRFYRLSFGRKNHEGETLVATEEHPVLIERNGEKLWEKIKNIHIGDRVFIQYKKCFLCGEKIPYYNKFCRWCNPAQDPAVQKKISKSQGGRKINIGMNDSTAYKHLLKDILPACKKLQKEGWSIIPVGGGIIPDAVGFKDGKTVIFEFEGHRGTQLKRKQEKYDKTYINDFADEIRWINIKEKMLQGHNSYEVDTEMGFIKVPVMEISEVKSKTKTKTVYNLEVEGDHAYFASKVLVHNSFERQTLWLKRAGIQPSCTAWLVNCHINEGSVNRLTPTLLKFF